MLQRPAISSENLGQVVELHQFRHRWVTALAWSAAHDILAVANAFDVSLYRFQGDTFSQQRITGHTEPVRTATISADGDWLISGGDDSRVGVWNIAPDQPNYTYQIEARGPVAAVAAAPHRHELAFVVGQMVYYGAYDGATLKTWAASERDLTATLYSPDGAWLLATGWDGSVRAMTLATGDVHVLDTQAERINALTFNHAGTLLAAVSRAGRLTTYHWPSGEIAQSVDMAHEAKAIDSVIFSPDDALLLTGGRDHLCRVWHPQTLEPLGQLAGHRKPVLTLGFSGGGQLLATGSGDNTVRLWGVPTAG